VGFSHNPIALLAGLLPFINDPAAIIWRMDNDSPHPHCPFCGNPMQFARSVLNFGAQSALPAFDCKECGVVLRGPPGAESFRIAMLGAPE
jgi:hypothetical protein